MDILSKVYEHLRGERKGYAQNANYASQCGNPCKRALVYNRLNWKDKELPDEKTLLVFREGNIHEEGVLRLLQDSGFKVTEQQRPFEIEKLNLRGRIDCLLDGIPCEIKSMNQNTFDKINSYDDLANSDKAYLRGYTAQIMVYLLMANKEYGILLLKCRNTGRLKQIDVQLDYDVAEGIWQKLLEVENFVQKKEYPERIEDKSSCRYCPFKSLCLPNEGWDQVQIMSEPEMLLLLEKREALKPMAGEYKKIDEKIKDSIPEEAAEYLYGRFCVSKKGYKTTVYNYPPEVKTKYAEKIERFKVNIVNLEEKSNDD